jgi:peptidoglycan LD-endopeptidase CwlK
MWGWLQRFFGMSSADGTRLNSPASPGVSMPNSTPGPLKHAAAPGLAEPRTLRNLATLDTETRKLAEALLELAWQEAKLDLRVTSGTRTMAEQRALYNQPTDGRDNDGDGRVDESDERVTKARPGYSWHNFGVAFDVTVFRGGKPVWDGPDYDTAGRLGQRLGLEWGGAWTSFKDRPHFQRKTGMTLAEARQKWRVTGDK